jgi:hypothetical protein
MITPTIGRVVWYQPPKSEDQLPRDQPYAGLIAFVTNDHLINLAYFDENGTALNARGVMLLQEGDSRPATGHYAEWMPYQKGQAAKYEELEAEKQKA